MEHNHWENKTILVAPLNWGLGHAARTAALIDYLRRSGARIILAGDGKSGLWLRRHYPTLKYWPMPELDLHYSRHNHQILCLLGQLWKVIGWMHADKCCVREIARQEKPDYILSDNRPGFRAKDIHSIYITHQVRIHLPQSWRWAEGIATAIHRHLFKSFDEVWIPDYEQIDKSLAGELSHPAPRGITSQYIGPLSRLEPYLETPEDTRYDTLILLSGLEPQRSIWEKELIEQYAQRDEEVLLIEGRIGEPNTRRSYRHITIQPWIGDEALAACLKGCHEIVVRSGYSTIMDLALMGVIDKARFTPTPGQSEQEYLKRWSDEHRPR